jgi:drug/metabolite transporter (DMT)-like permease
MDAAVSLNYATPEFNIPMRPSPAYSIAILLGVTLIWGTTFVATRLLVAGDHPALSAGALIFWRFFVAAMLFTPALLGRGREPGLWRAGLELSFWLWCGFATQAIGMVYTTASRSAFVTSLNVVFVPALTALAGRRVGWVIWLAAAAALGGAALLSYDGSTPNRGDVWTLGCALIYAIYILRLEHFAGRFRSRPLTAVQLWGVAGLSLIWAGGEMAYGAGWGDWTPRTIGIVLYLAIVATALTTWLQAIGQRGIPGTHASLLYTTEPVFAAVIAAIVLGEWLGPRGLLGAGIVLTAAIASQMVSFVLSRRRAAVVSVAPV